MVERPMDPYIGLTERSIASCTVLEITMDREGKLNALPQASIDSLHKVLTTASRDDGDVIVITGAGEVFTSGFDLGELELDTKAIYTESAAAIHGIVDAIRDCPLPVVARVNGPAFGVGMLVCMAADIVVATRTAEFALQEVRLGIPVAGYATAILPRLVGDRTAREWLLTGRVVPADEAESDGFVTTVVPQDDLEEAIASVIHQLGAASSDAITLLKQRMADPTQVGSREAIRAAELDAICSAFVDGDLRERIQSFR